MANVLNRFDEPQNIEEWIKEAERGGRYCSCVKCGMLVNVNDAYHDDTGHYCREHGLALLREREARLSQDLLRCLHPQRNGKFTDILDEWIGESVGHDNGKD